MKGQWGLVAIGLSAGVFAACTTTLAEQPAVTSAPSSTPSVSAQPSATAVVRVVDGDTIVVGAEHTTVRIIGVNTPETVAPGQPVGCYGPQASARAHELLDGKVVNLVPDPTQSRLDRYGRTLAYVEVNGLDVGLELLKGGFAKAYKVSGPAPQRWTSYTAAESQARQSNAGLWGACVT